MNGAKEFYVADDHSIWLTFEYLYVFLKNSGWEKLKFAKWLAKFLKTVQSVAPAPPARPEGIPKHMITSDTMWLVTFLTVITDTCRHKNQILGKSESTILCFYTNHNAMHGIMP